jgi:outer membrane biosynthesis protein TonB
MARNKPPRAHSTPRRKPKPKDHTKRKPEPKDHTKRKPEPKTTTERLKEKSKQTGPEAMAATPGLYPQDPANAQAVFTTGPGEAVEYNYVRVDGSQEDYALAQSEQYAYVPPVAGYGQTVTSGAAQNPT